MLELENYMGKKARCAFSKISRNLGKYCVPDSVADPDPEGSETFGWFRIRSGTDINVLDPDSNPDPNPKPDSNPDPK
jgi:hypothetical protein